MRTFHGTLRAARRIKALAAWVAVPVAFFGLAAPASATLLSATPPSFGSPGTEAGQLSGPGPVAANDVSHDVYVADDGNARIEEFSAEGTFIRAWGWGVADGAEKLEVCEATCQVGLAGAGEGQLNHPVAIAVDGDASSSSAGDVYVADGADNVVEKFDAEGHYLSKIDGSTAPHVAPQTAFEALAGVAIDGRGDVWTVDSATGDVDEFDPAGTYVPGSQFSDGYAASTAIAINPAATRLYLINGGAGGATEAWDPANPAAGATLIDGGGLEFATNTIFPLAAGVALTVDPVSENLYVEDVANTPEFTFLATIVSYDPTGKQLGHFGGIAAELGPPLGLSFDPTAKFSGSEGALYVPEWPLGDVRVFIPPPAIPPSVDSMSVSNVGATSAELRAGVNPNYFAARARFQYVTSEQFATSGYSGAASTPEFNLGAAGGPGADQAMRVAVSALQPHTLYHYRVLATGDVNGTLEITEGPDETFTTPQAPQATPPPAVQNPSVEASSNGVTPAPPRTYPNLTTLKPIPGPRQSAGKPKAKAKAKPCGKNQVKRKGKCIPKARARRSTHGKGSR